MCKKFANLIFQKGLLSLLQRATGVTKTRVTAIYHKIVDAMPESIYYAFWNHKNIYLIISVTYHFRKA